MPRWDIVKSDPSEHKSEQDFMEAFSIAIRELSKEPRCMLSPSFFYSDARAIGDLKCRFMGYRSCVRVKKTCVSANGFYSFPDKSYGITWVGLRLMDNAACMVARLSDMDMKFVGPMFESMGNDFVINRVTTSIIPEMEGIANTNGLHEKPGMANAMFLASIANGLYEIPGMAIKKPFGVVSVNQGTDQASSAKYDVKKAIHFLRKKMNSGSAFTMDDAVQTAISAFKYLCLEDVKAEDIYVLVWPNVQQGGCMLETSDIKSHLALIKDKIPSRTSSNLGST